MRRRFDRRKGDIEGLDPPGEERRGYLKTVGALVVGLAVGGAAAWLGKPAERITETITETITVTKTAPITPTPTPTLTPTPTPTPTPISLRMINCDYDTDAWLPTIIKDYNIKRQQEGKPPIEVGMKNVPPDTYDAAMSTAYVAGEQIDMVYFDTHWANYLGRKGILKDLFPLVSKEYLELYDPAFLQTVIDGCSLVEKRLYGLPTEMTAYGLYYNKDIFDDLGIEIPDWRNDPDVNCFTWDEIYEISDTMKRKGITPMVTHCGEEWQNGCMAANMLSQRVNNKLTEAFFDAMTGRRRYDDPEFIQAYQDLFELDQIMMEGWGSMLMSTACNEFGAGRAAMLISHPWLAPAVVETAEPAGTKFGVLPLPHRPPSKTQPQGGAACSYGVISTTRFPDEALDFCKFAVAPDQMYTYLMGAYGSIACIIPPNKGLYDKVSKIWFNGPEDFWDWLKINTTATVFYDWLVEPEIVKVTNQSLMAGIAGEITAKQVGEAVQSMHERNVKEGKNYYPQE